MTPLNFRKKSMRKALFVLSFLFLLSCQQQTSSDEDFITHYEKSGKTETPEYGEVIAYYQKLADTYSEISLFEMGITDSGNPLHLVVFNADGKIKRNDIKSSSKNRMLINNGIHPGESDGIDATMMMMRDIAQSDSLKNLYKNTLINVIPVYNIGGALNRNSHTRANQNGPKEYGFRGNAQNYDLNRDFVFGVHPETQGRVKALNEWYPQLMIDGHEMGADDTYLFGPPREPINKNIAKLLVFNIA